METLYKTTVVVKGGRNGHIKSEDGILDLEVRMPKELGGVEGYTNPEQLFAGGYAACFDSALNLVMGQEKIRPESPSVITATVGLNTKEGGGFLLFAKLQIEIPGIDKALAKELVEKAHQICPYSNATRGNMDVQLEVI